MKPNQRPRPGEGQLPHSRRTDVRFEPPPNLLCTVAGTGAQIVIRNISLGGLGLVSDIPLQKGVRLEILLTLGRLTVLARGHAVHSQRQDDGKWAIGIAFTKDLSTGPNVESLIDAIARTTIEFS